MGLLSKFIPSRPNLSLKPEKIYRVTVHTDQGSHKCVIFIPSKGDPAVLDNPIPFHMPEEPTFVATEPIVAEFPDRTVRGLEIVAVQESDLKSDSEAVDIPENMKGVQIPKVTNGTSPNFQIEYDRNNGSSESICRSE